MVAQTFDETEMDDDLEDELHENPLDEAESTWHMRKDVGLYAEEEEDIMTIFELKNKKRDAKKKSRNWSKNSRKNNGQAGSPSMYTKPQMKIGYRNTKG